MIRQILYTASVFIAALMPITVTAESKCLKEEASLVLAQGHSKEQRMGQALEMFSRFIEANKNISPPAECSAELKKALAAAYAGRGSLLLNKGDLGNAAIDFSEAISADKNQPAYFYNRALALGRDEQIDINLRRRQMTADLAEAVRLDYKFGMRAFQLLSLDMKSFSAVPERPEQAAEIKQLLLSGMQANAVDDEGRTALMYAAAWGHINTVRLLLDNNADPAAHDRSGTSALMLSIASGNDKIAAMLEPFAKSDQDFYALASLYLQRADMSRAMVHINAALRQNPRSADALLAKANIFMEMKDYDSAISAYQQALALKPDHREALFRLSLCYGFKASAISPDDYRAAGNQAGVYLKLGMADRAAEAFGRALDLALKTEDAQSGAPKYQAASWYALFLSRFIDAETFARKGLNLDPRSYGITANLAHALMLQGKTDAAVTEYRKYIEQNPGGSISKNITSLKDDFSLLKKRYPEKRVLIDKTGATLWASD